MAQEGCSKKKKGGGDHKIRNKNYRERPFFKEWGRGEESANDTGKNKWGKEAENEGCLDTEGNGGKGSMSFSSSAQRYKQSRNVKLRPAHWTSQLRRVTIGETVSVKVGFGACLNACLHPLD